MLTYEMPLYEVKYYEEDDWKEISELALMDELYKSFDKVTPAIKEMILGNEVKTPYGIFRLKLKGGEYGREQSELSAA
jgi:hypothetical protein